MKIKRIHQVAIFARDLDEAIAFYRDKLGAAFIAKFDPPGLAFFGFQKTRLLLEKTGRQSTIYFWVDDIDQTFEKLIASGVVFIAEPHLIYKDENGMFGKKGEEEWMAFFEDPSGNTLALATRKSPSS